MHSKARESNSQSKVKRNKASESRCANQLTAYLMKRMTSFNKPNNRNLRAVTNLTVIRLNTFAMLQFNNSRERTWLNISTVVPTATIWFSGTEFKTGLVSDTGFLIPNSLLQADTGSRKWGLQT